MLIDLLLDSLDKLIWTDERIGKYGETLTARKLKVSNFLGNKGKILRNLYLPTEEGGTSEIDLIYITQKGILVIESKNYSGWIFGRQYDQYWTQSLPNHSKNRFYNPIRQNYNHIKWLQQYLELDIPLFSFIVFSERCTLKNISLKDDSVFVMKRNDLRSYIKKVWKDHPDALTPEQITQISEKLFPLTQVDAAQKAAHIEAIRQKFDLEAVVSEPLPTEPAPPEPAPEPPAEQSVVPDVPSVPEPPEPSDSKKKKKVCPRCGAKLTLRTAKRGNNAGNQFYGCSAFPKCRYIMNITNQTEESDSSHSPNT